MIAPLDLLVSGCGDKISKILYNLRIFPTTKLAGEKIMLMDSDKALGYQQITNVSASIGLTVPAGTRMCMIQAETQSVRWRDDGTAPTSTIGYILAAGAELIYTGNVPTVLRFIETAASAKLNICYYG